MLIVLQLEIYPQKRFTGRHSALTKLNNIGDQFVRANLLNKFAITFEQDNIFSCFEFLHSFLLLLDESPEGNNKLLIKMGYGEG